MKYLQGLTFRNGSVGTVGGGAGVGAGQRGPLGRKGFGAAWAEGIKFGARLIGCLSRPSRRKA